MAEPPAIELLGVGKRYPGVVALEDVSLRVGAGEIHGLVGENGAGKSTLIKIATGAIRTDLGEVRVAGRTVTRPTRRVMRDLGVRAVFQERHVAPDLTVAENVLLDELPRRFGLVDRSAMRRESGRRLGRLGIDLDPGAIVHTLSVAQLQLIEIARSATTSASFLVLDEPTASLHRDESAQLFDVVRSLRDQGVGVLFISHHLDEVFALTTQVTVLRDGRVVAGGPTGSFDTRSLVRHMFGRDVVADRASAPPAPGPIAVSLRDIVAPPRLRGISLDVRRGEILAIAGAMGSGTSELAGIIAGTLRPAAGQAAVTDVAGRGTPRPIRGRRGNASAVAFLPADRKRRALLLDRSIADNVLVGVLASATPLLVWPRRLRPWATTLARRAGVRTPSVDIPVRTLSGGNQQKVLIARWLEVGVGVVVLDEPTAGVDVASTFEIYALLRRLAAAGMAIIVCTTDFQEASQVADRVILLRSGRVVAELSGADADEHRLVRLEMSA